jgi:hypothetical protein
VVEIHVVEVLEQNFKTSGWRDYGGAIDSCGVGCGGAVDGFCGSDFRGRMGMGRIGVACTPGPATEEDRIGFAVAGYFIATI